MSERVVDHSHPFLTSGIVAIAKKPTKSASFPYWLIFKPFPAETWCIICIVMLVVSCLGHFLIEFNCVLTPLLRGSYKKFWAYVRDALRCWKFTGIHFDSTDGGRIILNNYRTSLFSIQYLKHLTFSNAFEDEKGRRHWKAYGKVAFMHSVAVGKNYTYIIVFLFISKKTCWYMYDVTC